MPPSADEATAPLVAVLRGLQCRDYRFTTPTPLTHARVLARPWPGPPTLRDVFGWSRPFAAPDLAAELLAPLQQAGAVETLGDGRLRSRLRVSTLHDRLYLHSAYPTDAADAVFFGPDTYRFADFVRSELQALPTRARAVDIGCGSGAGALSAAARLPGAAWTLTDVNAAALRLAAANAAHAGVEVQLVESDLLTATAGEFDLVISNPPYVADPLHRAYRDGGAGMGRSLSERIVRESLPRLGRGGRLLLYTGVAMVDGGDPFLAALRPLLDDGHWRWSYRELDPDVFGEELAQPAYARAERIAVVGLRVERV